MTSTQGYLSNPFSINSKIIVMDTQAASPPNILKHCLIRLAVLVLVPCATYWYFSLSISTENDRHPCDPFMGVYILMVMEIFVWLFFILTEALRYWFIRQWHKMKADFIMLGIVALALFFLWLSNR
ncbi:hypothetical protein UNH65_21215 [Chitinophaga sp. 180180018-2]|uniref:hypothetical protein n=2 Tax=Chitinophaga TaxID=79328 RepID=UPI002DE4222F|nr:hypothetical protein [Chitinophaga sp. 212800010-3]